MTNGDAVDKWTPGSTPGGIKREGSRTKGQEKGRPHVATKPKAAKGKGKAKASPKRASAKAKSQANDDIGEETRLALWRSLLEIRHV